MIEPNGSYLVLSTLAGLIGYIIANPLTFVSHVLLYNRYTEYHDGDSLDDIVNDFGNDISNEDYSNEGEF